MEEKILIGRNVKAARIKIGITQQQLADACGLSKGMISKVENSVVVPAIGTLQKIAAALHVRVADLIEGNTQAESRMTVNPFEDPDRFLLTNMGYLVFNPAAGLTDTCTQPLLIMAYEGQVKPHEVCHPGEEYIFVFDGEMNFTVGDKTHLLRKGDSLFFDSTQMHGIHSVHEFVQYVDVFVSHEPEASVSEKG